MFFQRSLLKVQFFTSYFQSRHTPFLRDLPYFDNVSDIIDTWRTYKLSIPIFGAVILNSSLTKVLLVRSCSGNFLTFFMVLFYDSPYQEERNVGDFQKEKLMKMKVLLIVLPERF